MVRFDQIAKITKDQSASTISERDGQPFSLITAQITSNDINKVSSQADKALTSMELPKDVTYSLGGITEQVKEMIFDMSVAVAFSVLLVLLITSTIFKGWRAPSLYCQRSTCFEWCGYSINFIPWRMESSSINWYSYAYRYCGNQRYCVN